MHRANLNNHPELPELRHRRMPQALTTTMQSGSMRYGGRDSRSNMKDGTRSPVAMPACTVPSRVKWRHLAATLVGIAATLVPGVGVADDVYLRAGIGFDRPAETRFMDNDCSSVSPAALYGCGTGGDGAPLRSLGDFGTVASVEFGIGRILTRATRVEVLVEYRPRFAFDGRANFLEPRAPAVGLGEPLLPVGHAGRLRGLAGTRRAEAGPFQPVSRRWRWSRPG